MPDNAKLTVDAQYTTALETPRLPAAAEEDPLRVVSWRRRVPVSGHTGCKVLAVSNDLAVVLGTRAGASCTPQIIGRMQRTDM